jgi:hypothetical protein
MSTRRNQFWLCWSASSPTRATRSGSASLQPLPNDSNDLALLSRKARSTISSRAICARSSIRTRSALKKAAPFCSSFSEAFFVRFVFVSSAASSTRTTRSGSVLSRISFSRSIAAARPFLRPSREPNAVALRPSSFSQATCPRSSQPTCSGSASRPCSRKRRDRSVVCGLLPASHAFSLCLLCGLLRMSNALSFGLLRCLSHASNARSRAASLRSPSHEPKSSRSADSAAFESEIDRKFRETNLRHQLTQDLWTLWATHNHEMGFLVPRSSIVSVGPRVNMNPAFPGSRRPNEESRRPLMIGREYCHAGSSPLES